MDKKRLLENRIMELRKRQGSSQEKLAERAGMSVQYLRNIERGKENPVLDLRLRLLEALRVFIGQMCDFQIMQQMDQRKMRSAIREMLKKTGPESLKVALKVLKALV
jgi:transcriptional regulator with XRE-family HTH domain